LLLNLYRGERRQTGQRGQPAEIRSQGSEVRSRRAEVGGQRSEVESRRQQIPSPLPAHRRPKPLPPARQRKTTRKTITTRPRTGTGPQKAPLPSGERAVRGEPFSVCPASVFQSWPGESSAR